VNGMAYIAHDNLGLRPGLCTYPSRFIPRGRTDKTMQCCDAMMRRCCRLVCRLMITPSTHITWNKPRGQVRSGRVAIRAAPSLPPRIKLSRTYPAEVFLCILSVNRLQINRYVSVESCGQNALTILMCFGTAASNLRCQKTDKVA